MKKSLLIVIDEFSNRVLDYENTIEILKYSLKKGNYDAKWVFVESDMDTSTLSKGSVVYDDSISIELDSLVNPIDITAILVGDINGSV